jgi:hypothetical protein
MNNKIRKKLIKEFNKYNLDKNILDNYNFEIINKKFVYIKDNKKYNFIEIDDNKGVRLKRNSEKKFRLQILDTDSKKYNAKFLEDMVGGTKTIDNFFDEKKNDNLSWSTENTPTKWGKDDFSKYSLFVEKNIIDNIFQNREFYENGKYSTFIKMDEK